MITRFSTLSTTLALGFTMLLASGCGAKAQNGQSAEAEQISGALEEDNGGLTTTDESPMFGEASAYALEELPDPESAIADETESQPTVVDMMKLPAAKKYEAVLLWGQIPANLGNKMPHNWSGSIHVSRGAVIVRRTIRFEDKTDQLLPRTDPQSVEFTSVTLPANDGMRLTIVDPTPNAPEPLTVSYEGKDGVSFSAPLADLLSGPKSEDVDAAGNRFVGIAIDTPVDVCQHGFLGGHWRRVLGERGRLRGAVTDASGDVVGHMKGIWGQRKNGEHVFFGKYIDADGHFKGIFAGKYADGEYEGKWVVGGDAGKLGGRYFANDAAPGRIAGFYVGRYAETSCNLNVGSGGNLQP